MVRLPVASWLGSCLVGLLALGAAAADLQGLRARLVASARDDDPSLSADLAHEGVQATLAAAAAGTAVLLVLVAAAMSSATEAPRRSEPSSRRRVPRVTSVGVTSSSASRTSGTTRPSPCGRWRWTWPAAPTTSRR